MQVKTKETFLETIKSEASKTQYTLFLNKLENDLLISKLSKKNINEIKVYIENLDVKPRTKQDKHFIVKKYLDYLKLDCYKFNKNKIENKVVKELPSRKELQGLLKETKVDILQDKLVLNLLLNYAEVLRCDLSNVKVVNFDKTEPHLIDNTIVFPTINKTDFKNIIIELKPEEQNTIKELSIKSEYLLNFTGKNRSKSYSDYIKRITLKYIGKTYNQTDFRKISARNDLEELDIKKEDILKMKELESRAQKRGHSLNMAIDKYTNIMED